VATSVLFWWGLVYGRYGRAAYGASALYVFTTMVHTGILGALFALSTSPYYGVYRDRAAASGVDAIHTVVAAWTRPPISSSRACTCGFPAASS
jgi:putative membrane protein